MFSFRVIVCRYNAGEDPHVGRFRVFRIASSARIIKPVFCDLSRLRIRNFLGVFGGVVDGKYTAIDARNVNGFHFNLLIVLRYARQSGTMSSTIIAVIRFVKLNR